MFNCRRISKMRPKLYSKLKRKWQNRKESCLKHYRNTFNELKCRFVTSFSKWNYSHQKVCSKHETCKTIRNLTTTNHYNCLTRVKYRKLHENIQQIVKFERKRQIRRKSCLKHYGNVLNELIWGSFASFYTKLFTYYARNL